MISCYTFIERERKGALSSSVQLDSRHRRERGVPFPGQSGRETRHSLGGDEISMTPKPNLIWIMADDMGYGDVACHNPDSKIPTPNLDELALQGMRFTDAHAPSAVCTPTRYGVLMAPTCQPLEPTSRLRFDVFVANTTNTVSLTPPTVYGPLQRRSLVSKDF